ncbi:hypothetical protein EV363DRAFT_1311657 [Boletus edulis]|uniref:LYR motif-containing protein 2 n=1 Tax=Boletus edulis BED1 TaxID=1328754 RepID=A0AAD4C1Q4_BOLED|nr:hypothetical protein EV363DRAFT_1311657 [Boletus edulis]KAF8446102.1 hypothetical protein L210DRAFT_3529069 [Boletus edulis BED1]
MPSFRHFILQQRVLHLYRSAIRASRCIPDPRNRTETLGWFRAEIERNRHLTDTVAIENQLNAASREIRQLFPGTRC